MAYSGLERKCTLKLPPSSFNDHISLPRLLSLFLSSPPHNNNNNNDDHKNIIINAAHQPKSVIGRFVLDALDHKHTWQNSSE